MRADLRTEEGFGMIELLIAIVMLNVGILAIMAGFSSSQFTMESASQTATASTLAEKQMELYRAQLYANIALDAALTTTALGDSKYSGDSANTGTPVTKICAGSPSSVVDQCKPMQTVKGPDGVTYRVDTFITGYAPPDGRLGRKVTVVVRHATTLRNVARLVSTFDESTAIAPAT